MSIANASAACAQWLNRVSALVVLGLVVLINADVFSRTLFDAPLRGVTELVALAIPAIVFLSVARLLADDKLIRTDVLLRWLRPRAPVSVVCLQMAFSIIAAVLAAAIAASTWPDVVYAWTTDEFVGVEGDFTVQVWPLKVIVFSGAVLMTVLSLTAVRRYAVLPQIGPTPLRWIAAVAIVVVPVMVIAVVTDTRAGVGAAAVALMFLFVYAGLPVAFALMAAAVTGIALLKGDPLIAGNTLGLVASGAVSNYLFAAVPLFVLMGLIVGAADIGRDSLQAAHWLLARVKGGLGVATVAANAVFAAITGISIASAAIFSKVAVPPLIEHGFTPRFSVGLVAGSSVLGMLIPPSILLIVYGIVAEVSIGKLFIAAILPGLVLAAAFALLVVCVAWWRPRFAVAGNIRGLSRDIDARTAAAKALPVAILIAVVLGGIYGGVFTPTEAGAVGTLAATTVALTMRRIRLIALWRLLCEATASSASILFLIVSASAFAIMLTLSGIPGQLGELIATAGLGLGAYMVAYLIILVILGMILDSTSILLIMVPLALPTVVALEGNLIWFGIVTVIGVEIGLLTPPLGLSVYAIKSAIDDDTLSLSDIFIGTAPFVGIMLLVALLLIAVPGIALGLL